MKFNVDAQVIGYNGKPIPKSADDDSPVSLGEVLSMACVNANPQKHSTGEDKMKIYRILQKTHAGGEVELEVEEVALLKTLVGESYGVPMVGPVYDLLEKQDD